MPPPRVAYLLAEGAVLRMALVATDAAQAARMLNAAGEGEGFAARLADAYAEEGGTLQEVRVGAEASSSQVS